MTQGTAVSSAPKNDFPARRLGYRGCLLFLTARKHGRHVQAKGGKRFSGPLDIGLTGTHDPAWPRYLRTFREGEDFLSLSGLTKNSSI